MARDGAVRELSEGGLVLGLIPDMPYEEAQVELEDGQILAIYTDGVTDAMNLEGELFGHSRLKKAVRERCSNSAQGICDDIMQLVMNHQRSLPQHDDVTLVAVRALD